MNRRTTRRGLVAASAAVVSASLLAGCGTDTPPQPEAGEPFDGPVLTEEQETDIVTAVGETLDKGDKKLDAKALDSRVTGPALELRKVEYDLAETTDDKSYLTAIPSESEQQIIPTTQNWGRTSFSITTQPEVGVTNRLVAYDQAAARDDYKMWAWVQLIPGVMMPAFADAGIGSEGVAADDESLAATPGDALSQYADIVGLGPKKSSFSKSFDLPENDLVGRVQDDAENLRGADGFSDADGKLAIDYDARKDEVRTVQTADGGALVMGVLDGSFTTTVEEGGTVGPPSGTQAALFGDQEQTDTLTAKFTDMVALYVPPKDSDEKIRPLGYTHNAVSATNE